MRLALGKHYGDKAVGLGGAFLIKKGNAKLHVMQDFSETPITTDEQVNEWLRFYECHAPLVNLSTFVSHDPVSVVVYIILIHRLSFFAHQL